MTPEDEQPPGWKVSNMLPGKSKGQLLSRKNEVPGPKQKQCPVVDASGSESKVLCCREQYCKGTWNYSKLDVVKQVMARVNIDILETSELNWMRIGEFNLDDYYIYYCEKESLRRNGVALTANRRVQTAVLECNLKNDRKISVPFQGKPLNTRVIKVYVPTTNAEEAEVEKFYEDPQDLLELTPKKRYPFHHRGLECKSRKSRDT